MSETMTDAAARPIAERPTEEQPPFRQVDQPLAVRARDLLDRLTPDERIAMLHQAAPAIERLGVAAWHTGCEALHGAASPTGCGNTVARPSHATPCSASQPVCHAATPSRSIAGAAWCSIAMRSSGVSRSSRSRARTASGWSTCRNSGSSTR